MLTQIIEEVAMTRSKIICMLLWRIKVTPLVLLFSVGSFYTTYCQERSECGDPKINVTAMDKAELYLSTRAKAPVAPARLIRVYFHVCRDDDGTNAGATETDIENEFNQLITDYAPFNICFANMGLNYIDDTRINTNFDYKNDESLLYPYLVDRCLDIFYHYSIKGAGGTAYAIPNTFCSIANGKIGDRAVSHEVGHCFGLFHTFQDCDESYIDGTKCSKKGDHVCDTEADPYCFKNAKDPCFTNSGCSYTGSCADAGGKTNWSPPYNNIMSYWNAEGCNRTVFTTGQYDRMDGYLTTDASLQNCESPDNTVIDAIDVTSGDWIASAVNQLYTSGDVQMSGTIDASIAAAEVLLEPGFHAFPSSGGKIFVQGSSCTYSLPKKMSKLNFKNIVQASHDDEVNGLELRAYPNPTTSQVNIEFHINHENKAIIEVYDMSGRKVKEVSFGSLLTGKQHISIDLANLSPGLYDLRLKFSDKSFNTKVMLIK